MLARWVIFLLLLLPGVAAEQNATIFDSINMTVFNGSLMAGANYTEGCNRSYSETWGTVWYPGHRVIESVYISASIDITGYAGMVLIDGVECVGGCPSDLAIISQEASTGYTGFEANEDWIKRDITIVSEDGNTTATMVVSFMWHWTTYSSTTGTNSKHYYLETKTVSVTKPHPKIINLSHQMNATAYITYYNDSVTPIALIDVSSHDSVIKTVYTYNNTSITKYNAIGVVYDSHVEFLNDSTTWQADPGQTTMIRRGESAIIRGEQLNMSLLNITISTPYAQHTIDDMRLSVVEPHEARPWLFVQIMATVGTLIAGMVMMLGAVRRSL